LRRINAIVASCWIYFTIKHDAGNHKYKTTKKTKNYYGMALFFKERDLWNVMMQRNRVLPGSTRYQSRGAGKEQKGKNVGRQNKLETLCQSINIK